MQKVIAVMGPTASGKTALAVSLAKRFDGEVISADSMQIYREMQIGTAKPTEEERDGVPHHLIGHVGVEECYNVASYVRDARGVLAELDQRGVLPVLCGGTGLYLDHLLNATEFFEIPQRPDIRQQYQQLDAKTLYAMLTERDPALAASLHPNDTKRVIRGLEVYDITGKRLSDFQRESRRESPYEVLYVGLNYQDRALLYERIDRRVDQMLEQGLADEVRYLLKHFRLSATARAAIGYKELIDALQSGGSMDAAAALVKQKTRNYAKRQITWFKRNPNVHWLYPDLSSDIAEQGCALAEHFLKGEAI